MDPYRTMERGEVPEAPRDPGIVGDVIAQFADPNAFYRELVQNSIDAGSPSIEVRLEHDTSEQVMHVSVRDRGEGMTRDILENQLLVLFRSTKEKDLGKIGKFGIGFASVLAPNPDVVIVQTARDRQRLTLHLYRDLTYELFDAGPATQPGTTVELVIPMHGEAVEPFVSASVGALVRWCRHAAVPIELVYVPPAGPIQTTRIDRPLAIEGAIVEVSARSDDGQLLAVVGIGPGLGPYTGFFNHGLTLFETRDPLVGSFAVKVQDSRLGHTLSRDNVRRDEAFDRAVAFARALAQERLPAIAAIQLRAAAETADRTRYRTLSNAIMTSGLRLAAEDWSFPLAEPLAEARSITAAALGKKAWISDGPTPVTALMTRAGVPVVELAAEDHERLAAWIDARYRCRLVRVNDEMSAVTPIAEAPADVALLAFLGELLAAAGKAPSSIVLARLSGAHAGFLAIAGDRTTDDPTAPYLIDRATASHSPFGRLRRPPLTLSAEHRLVKTARAGDPRLAASHLARVILLEFRLLDVAISTRLLAHTLELFGGPR